MDTSLRASRIVETDRSTIEAELSRLLMVKKFSGAPQMSAFLYYIVTQTLEGNGDRIKAYTVGVDALGKPHTFDAQSDPSVRVLALRLRKTLAAIYESDATCHVQISLKVGTYVPEFFKVVVSPPTLADVSDTQVPPMRDRQKLDTESTTQLHVLSEPVNMSATQNRELGQLLPNMADTVFRTSSGTAVFWNKSTQGLLLPFMLIFLLFWMMSGGYSNAYLNKLSAGVPLSTMPLEASMSLAVSTSKMPQQSPTLYLIDDVKQSRQLQHVSMLLGSSVVQNSSFNVIRVSKAKVPIVSSQGDYHMVLNELLVDNHWRLDAQVLRLGSGVVVTSSTMMFDNSTESFTRDEIRRLEDFAETISAVSGPLYEDFCMNNYALEFGSCRQEDGRELSALVNKLDSV